MTDLPALATPTLAEIGTVYSPTPGECEAVRGLVDRYALDEHDRQLLADILGIRP